MKQKPKNKSIVHKQFLSEDPTMLDDSYISYAVIEVAEGVQAGISIHDGHNTICFQWTIPRGKLGNTLSHNFDCMTVSMLDSVRGIRSEVGAILRKVTLVHPKKVK